MRFDELAGFAVVAIACGIVWWAIIVVAWAGLHAVGFAGAPTPLSWPVWTALLITASVIGLLLFLRAAFEGF